MKFLTFTGPCIVIYFYSKPTRCTSFSNLFILNWHCTCFRRSFRPSSGVQDCTYKSIVIYVLHNLWHLTKIYIFTSSFNFFCKINTWWWWDWSKHVVFEKVIMSIKSWFRQNTLCFLCGSPYTTRWIASNCICCITTAVNSEIVSRVAQSV
jgi:hypothetical protein